MNLLDDYNNEKWKTALIRAETALMEINRRKGSKPKWFSNYSLFSQNQNTVKPAAAASKEPSRQQPAEKKESPSSSSMGITYPGQGQSMDLSKARSQGLCFKCGEKGHLACNCKNLRVFRTRCFEHEGQLVEVLEKIEPHVPKGDFPNLQ